MDGTKQQHFVVISTLHTVYHSLMILGTWISDRNTTSASSIEAPTGETGPHAVLAVINDFVDWFGVMAASTKM